jgi:hypothetical protein
VSDRMDDRADDVDRVEAVLGKVAAEFSNWHS